MRTFTQFFTVALLCITACCYAKPANNELFGQVVDGRCYVQPEYILIDSQGIFLVSEETIIPVISIEVDQQGIFVRLSEDGYERCPGCKLTKVNGKCQNRKCSRYGT